MLDVRLCPVCSEPLPHSTASGCPGAWVGREAPGPAPPFSFGERALCASCGAPITFFGRSWDHDSPPGAPHPASPRTIVRAGRSLAVTFPAFTPPAPVLPPLDAARLAGIKADAECGHHVSAATALQLVTELEGLRSDRDAIDRGFDCQYRRADALAADLERLKAAIREHKDQRGEEITGQVAELEADNARLKARCEVAVGQWADAISRWLSGGDRAIRSAREVAGSKVAPAPAEWDHGHGKETAGG